MASIDKHDVRFSDAESVVVIDTHRGDDIRLISARRATRNERAQYEEGI